MFSYVGVCVCVCLCIIVTDLFKSSRALTVISTAEGGAVEQAQCNSYACQDVHSAPTTHSASTKMYLIAHVILRSVLSEHAF